MKRPRITREDFVDSLSGALAGEMVQNAQMHRLPAGAITAVAVCPLDVLRTRFQVQARNQKYTGLASNSILYIAS